jgi:hypothetical protein
MASKEYLIRDIDVSGQYVSIAIVNDVFPAHLGKKFSEEYANLPKERKRWQAEKGKKCVEANTLKLAGNGVYGNSNSPYSVFYDPQYTMTITINGQLMLCMLAEKLVEVPTLKILQINTDGISYYIKKEFESQAAEICKNWQELTKLTLEDANYRRFWIRDVNNYIAESMDGKLKLKGAYWTPDEENYAQSIAEQQPPAWHKDLSNLVSTRAAVAYMVNGIKPEQFIKDCKIPYTFMLRAKARGQDKLMWGNEQVQKTNRYYVSTDGREFVKLSPPTGQAGMYKKKNGVSDFEYQQVMQETSGQWDARVCTGKAGKPDTQKVYEERRTSIEAGKKVTICNNIADFSFENIDYDYYIEQAEKLII